MGGINGKPLETLKGIGGKTAQLFGKLGIFTVEDLLEYYPRGYEVYEQPVAVGTLKPDCVMAVEGVLFQNAALKRYNNLQVVTAVLKDLTGSLQLSWFNMPYLSGKLKAGTYGVFRGRVARKNNRLVMEQPEIFTKEGYQQLAESMKPVYGQTKGLSNKTIRKAQQQALASRQMERDYLPQRIRLEHQLAEYNFAIEHIHFPSNRQELLFARKRLVFDEFFLFILGVRRLREARIHKESCFKMKMAPEVALLEQSLPYALTQAQEKVLGEIWGDMEGGLVMNRLVQGDVGCGKTILAVLALLLAACNGCQGAMMVPTEVLARQHYSSITSLFETCHVGKKAILVTGSMTAKEKEGAYEKIRTHQVDIIVGTHALIQEKVVYHKLALVVTDEQHRFGVGQRQLLGNKGENPHVLVMSATPIPRTLAIILYGDLDISVIDQLPANRLPIKNCVVGKKQRQKAYRFLYQEVAAGRQAYVICPMVEASEMLEGENVSDYAEKLRQVLPGVRISCLHGKMKPKEKNEVMEDFLAEKIQVLVSTTVVEVGVNVPNATVMMVENAERFGLAQLHQLRGRVGRGGHQSYCILVDCSQQEGVEERLEILSKSNDGFFIASEDLRLRGPGDIFGLRQSGDMEFKLADIFTDANLLQTVSQEVGQLLEQDPELAQEDNWELKKRLDWYLRRKDEGLSL